MTTKTEALVTNDEESGEEEGSGQLLEWAGFVVRAAGRHRRLFFAVLGAMTVLALAATALIPRVYEVNEKILAQRPLVLTSLVNPNRPISGEADIPTRGVQDMILRRDSLVAIVKETNLIDLWDVQRPAILRMKDKLSRAFSGPPSDEDKISALVGLLQQKLQVQVEEQSIKVSVQWDHPKTAFDIVNVAVKNFLEDRSASELAVLGETIGILDDELKKQGDEVAAALLDLRRLRAKQLEGNGVAIAPPAPAPNDDAPKPSAAPKPEPEAAPQPTSSASSILAAQLADKRKQIKELEEPRQKQLSELYAQLADLKSHYADANPLVVAKEQQIKEASVEPPELAKLEAEERALLEGGDDDLPPELQVAAAAPTKTTSAPPKAAPKPKPAATNAIATSSNTKEEDPDLTQARTRLNAATIKYQELSNRIESARMEVLSAQAAFKYRYTIVQPAELPKKPTKPNVPMVLVAGLMFALLTAIGAAAAKDVLSGRVIEAWQVKRRLKLPVLAQVRLER
jgi:uncharacterized protein involved in exopolysaccharide biosynthesis